MTIAALPALNRASATFKADADDYFETLLPTFTASVAAGMREQLSAPKTIYVSASGTNAPDRGDVVNPLLTMQYAVDLACTYDLGLFGIIIQVAAGTWTQGVALKKYVTGGGVITIRGDTTTPANVLMSTTSASCFSADGMMEYRIEGFKLQTTTAGYGVLVNSLAKINLGNMAYGACANDHIYALNGGLVGVTTSYAITASAPAHMAASSGAFISAAGITVTLTGTPAFATAYAKAEKGSVISLEANAYSGSATGVRYSVTTNAVISSGVTLPGGTAGTTATGGQYV